MTLSVLSSKFFTTITNVNFKTVSSPPLHTFGVVTVLTTLKRTYHFYLVACLKMSVTATSLFTNLMVNFNDL